MIDPPAEPVATPDAAEPTSLRGQFLERGPQRRRHSRDKPRPSRIPPLGPEVAERVVALTLTDPPVEITHWTADLMARASGISASAVRRI